MVAKNWLLTFPGSCEAIKERKQKFSFFKKNVIMALSNKACFSDSSSPSPTTLLPPQMPYCHSWPPL